ncbi:MAG: hypothetical protein HY059_10045 [Proteobacteria bacterium]|nr:hypothetical protein [Pseudomonadota bacterium]
MLIASILLAMAAGYIASSILNSKRMFKTSTYQYVAVNLARDLIEFGVSASIPAAYGHLVRLRYYYPPASSNSLNDGTCGSVGGTSSVTGYAQKEWYCFGGAVSPFWDMGDIKARGLVPKGAPDSVDISYELYPDPAFYGFYKHNVTVRWEEDGVKHRRDLSTVSIAQTNDQLHLQLSEFTWRPK